MNGLKLPSTFVSRRPAMPLLAALLVSFLPGSRPRGDAVAATGAADLGPAALAISSDARRCYIACAVSREVLVFDTERQRITLRWPAPAAPSGLVLSADGKRLFVTCAAPGSQVCVFDAGSGKLLQRFAAGHTALGPVLSRDERTLFVCNRFNHALSFIDVSSGAEIVRVPVSREPVSAALAPDGAFLLVANHLPSGRSDTNYVAAAVSIVDIAARRTTKELRLPNGSINLRDLRVSPDGRHAAVAHSVGRFQLPVTQLHRGWVNTSALTLIDLGRLEILNTVLLDDPDRGAANPWALAWSTDGRWLGVTHAGTHELSLIDFPRLLSKLAALADPANTANDAAFMTGIRRRVQLSGSGPRALAFAEGRAVIPGYFSDTLEVVELPADQTGPKMIELNPGHESAPVRLGEMYFSDANLCFQGWQSCASCHDDDGRVDGLNWDLLNDGIGNPKDTKSLLLSHQTPPVMSLGVRATAEIAVRNGIQNSLASSLPEAIAADIDRWLKSLKPAPSPFLVNGQLSPSARRGEKIFNSPGVGCASCHVPGLYTDLHAYAVGTENSYDQQVLLFDTPTLYELWRTAPYLHDGSAATLRDVLTTRNPKDEHGYTSKLSSGQLDDLVEYLNSL